MNKWTAALCLLVLLSTPGCRRRVPRSVYAAPPPPPAQTNLLPPPPPMPAAVPGAPMPPPPAPPMLVVQPVSVAPVAPRRLSPNQMISVTYGSASPQHKQLEDWLLRERPFDRHAEFVSGLVKLPRHIFWRVEECDGLAFWSPKAAALIICYRYFELLAREAQPGDIGGIIDFTLFHEVGHALASELSLPIVGNDENAADTFAATLLLANTKSGSNVLLPSIRFFHRLAGKFESTLWDEHRSDGQRYFDLLCLSWGSGERREAEFTGVLPEERRVGCRAEYVRGMTSWDRLLAPYSRYRSGETFWPR